MIIRDLKIPLMFCSINCSVWVAVANISVYTDGLVRTHDPPHITIGGLEIPLVSSRICSVIVDISIYTVS